VIQPRLAPSNSTQVSQLFTGLVCASQVVPPSRLRRICPANPTAQPFLASRKFTELSDQAAAVVLICSQVWPPSVSAKDGPGPAHGPTVLRVQKVHALDGLRCAGGLAGPGAPAIAGVNQHAGKAGYPARLADKLNVGQVLGGSGLPGLPGLAAVLGSQQHAAIAGHKPRFTSVKAIARMRPCAPVSRAAQVAPPSVVTITVLGSQRTYATEAVGAAPSRKRQDVSCAPARAAPINEIMAIRLSIAESLKKVLSSVNSKRFGGGCYPGSLPG